MKTAAKFHVIRMTVDRWISLPEHPKQRPTKPHALKAHAKHLKEPADQHRHVDACQLPDGTLFKADGHSRAYLWEQGLLARPEGRLVVTVHHCADLDEANRIYDSFDNATAAETAGDRLGGALGLHGIIMPPNELQKSLTTALQIVDKPAPITALVEAWKPEIILAARVDEGLPARAPNGGRPKLGGAMVAGMLATFRRHKEEVLPLWKDYRQNNGSEINNYRCPVRELVLRRQGKSWGLGGSTQRTEATEQVLGTVERWIADKKKRCMHLATPLDLAAYLRGENVTKPGPR